MWAWIIENWGGIAAVGAAVWTAAVQRAQTKYEKDRDAKDKDRDRQHAKELDEVSQKLRAELAARQSMLATHLQLEAAKEQTRFTKLHEKRFEVIAEMYRRIRLSHRAVASLINIMQQDGPEEGAQEAAERQRFKEWADEWNGLQDYFLANAIYLPDELEVQVVKYMEEAHGAFFDWKLGKQYREHFREWYAAHKKVQGMGDGILKELGQMMRQAMDPREQGALLTAPVQPLLAPPKDEK